MSNFTAYGIRALGKITSDGVSDNKELNNQPHRAVMRNTRKTTVVKSLAQAQQTIAIPWALVSLAPLTRLLGQRKTQDSTLGAGLSGESHVDSGWLLGLSCLSKFCVSLCVGCVLPFYHCAQVSDRKRKEGIAWLMVLDSNI